MKRKSVLFAAVGVLAALVLGVVVPVAAPGAAAPAAAATARPKAPSITVQGGDTKLSVAWGKVSGATKYEVDVATSPNFTTGKKSRTITSTGTVFAGLTNRATYYARVYAIAGSVKSKPSAVKSGKPWAGYPPQLAVTAKPGPRPDTITVSWTWDPKNPIGLTQIVVVAGVEAALTAPGRLGVLNTKSTDTFHSAWLNAAVHSTTLTIPSALRGRLGTGSGNPIYVVVGAYNQPGSPTAIPLTAKWTGQPYFRWSTTLPTTYFDFAKTTAKQTAFTFAPGVKPSGDAVTVGEWNVQTVVDSDNIQKDPVAFQWRTRISHIANTVLLEKPNLLFTEELTSDQVYKSGSNANGFVPYADTGKNERAGKSWTMIDSLASKLKSKKYAVADPVIPFGSLSHAAGAVAPDNAGFKMQVCPGYAPGATKPSTGFAPGYSAANYDTAKGESCQKNYVFSMGSHIFYDTTKFSVVSSPVCAVGKVNVIQAGSYWRYVSGHYNPVNTRPNWTIATDAKHQALLPVDGGDACDGLIAPMNPGRNLSTSKGVVQTLNIKSPVYNGKATLGTNAIPDKIFSWALLKEKGAHKKTVLAVSVHLPANSTSAAPASIVNGIRQDEIKALDTWITNTVAKLRKGGALVEARPTIILSGDFNSSFALDQQGSGGNPASTLLGAEGLMRNRGWYDAYSTAGARTGTFYNTQNIAPQLDNPGVQGYPYTAARLPYPGSRIDYIFTKNSPGSYWYTNLLKLDSRGKFVTGYRGSDHNFQLAKVAIG